MDWLKDVYLVCALVGGTALVVQTVLLALGGTVDGDADASAADAGGAAEGHEVHPGDAAFVKWLSLKTFVALLTFFGLGGLAAQQAGMAPVGALAVALLAGAVAVVAVSFLMASLGRLQSRGNIDLVNALGRVGTAYLRIPAGRAGRGKVTLEVQGRSIEVEAVTAGPEIPTGAAVRVEKVDSQDLVEVVRV